MDSFDADHERKVIAYLAPLMEANIGMIGELMFPVHTPARRRELSKKLIRQMQKKGLVVYLKELDAWRLSRMGRMMFDARQTERSSA